MSQTQQRILAVWLSDCFFYDHETGLLYWKYRPFHHFSNERGHKTFNSKFPSKLAGRIDGNGYMSVKISQRRYMLHRIVWALVTGFYPSEDLEIDHIDRNKSNNLFENLRLATRQENCCNQNPRRDNTSGFKGVGRCNGRWRATIIHRGKFKHLGMFDSPESAHEFYCLASDMLRGEFSSHG